MRTHTTRACAALLAAALLAACEPALAPDAPSAPAPAGFDALLRAMHRDRDVDPALVKAMEGLVAAVEQPGGTYAAPSAPPAVTPGMEAMLRGLPAAQGDAEAMLRIFRQVADQAQPPR